MKLSLESDSRSSINRLKITNGVTSNYREFKILITQQIDNTDTKTKPTD